MKTQIREEYSLEDASGLLLRLDCLEEVMRHQMSPEEHSGTATLPREAREYAVNQEAL